MGDIINDPKSLFPILNNLFQNIFNAFRKFYFKNLILL